MNLNENKKQLIMFANHQLPHRVVQVQFVINAYPYELVTIAIHERLKFGEQHPY